jgi:hypothetical protein
MTINRLNQGTTNQVLVKAISGQTTNLLELQDSSGNVVSSIGPTGALTGIGKILQVVRATDTTTRSTTSTSLTDVTGVSVTITPQKSNSTIMLIFTATLNAFAASGAAVYGRLTMADSANNSISGSEDVFQGNQNFSYTGNGSWLGYTTMIGFASPNTTSAVTYKMRFRVDLATTTFAVRPFSGTTQMYAIEVAA